MSSYYFLQAEKNGDNASFLDKLEKYADANKRTIYVLDRPLTDQKYNYKYNGALIILTPRHKISLLNYGVNEDAFNDFIEDVVEDIGSISDKYNYKDTVGRPRTWRDTLIESETDFMTINTIEEYLNQLKIDSDAEIKKLDLLISLFIGSINDINRVKADVPSTTLDKVKQKIQLFDGDQTRFIYRPPDKKRIIIQGLSGTGKTELLLHKLKDLYINDPDSQISFTCFNRILADNLKKRIPAFFNFMKVEQQIEWERRLWCTHAWGSEANPNSGAYRYICAFYQIPFFTYSYIMPFSTACKLAIDEINAKYPNRERKFAFTHMFIDESQDFDEGFFQLCELVTEKNIYVAGDIFQSIFDERISTIIEPDFLLGKCYRTDPKTLMFAHGLGMGLFEQTKLRWLEEKEWKDCGYNVKVENKTFFLSREPLRRFEDLDENFESIKVVEVDENFEKSVIEIIQQIIDQNGSVTPDDIGIILLDNDKQSYGFADSLSIKIQIKFRWDVNKAYESKQRRSNAVFISNRNNVKGLEFPFVICITKKIRSSLSYRNAIYTMLTRSFIKSYLLIPPSTPAGMTEGMKRGLAEIIEKKQMIVDEPSEEEKENIRTRFKYNLRKVSPYDLMIDIFQKLEVEKQYHEKLIAATKQLEMFESDEETLTEFIKDNLKYIKEK